MSLDAYTLPLIIGLILDTIFGDPYRMPHPIKWFGHMISFGENRWNKGAHKRRKGMLMSITLILIVFSTLGLTTHFLTPYPNLLLAVNSLFVFFGLANHSLIKEGWRVEKTLHTQGLEAGRKQLSYIVGRETKNLNEQEIRTAVLETLAENLSDGVIAPLFYYAIGGIPLMLGYKMVNTLDSMIGYKSDRYIDFGRFAAIFDDIVNYFPARITAIIMAIISFSPRAISFIFKYGHKHASPNAGYPESALAGILNVRFGGPNTYHGKLLNKPYIGYNNQPITHRHLTLACIVNGVSCLTMALIILFIHT